MHDRDWRGGVYMAEFASAHQLTLAVRSMLDSGYTRLETCSPVPLDTRIPRSRSRLPMYVFIAGVMGGVLSYAIQWFANVYSYPLDIGGRPAHAVPAFLIPTFEGVVLAASLAAFVGFFVSAHLPQPWHPAFEIDGFERATIDRYWLAVDAADPRASRDQTIRELDALEPLRLIEMHPEP